MAILEDVQSLIREAESSCNTEKSKRFHQVFGTRWLSFEGSLDALLKNYSALLSVLLEDPSGKAQGLLKQCSSYKFLHVASFMADAMCQLCILSRMFQKDDLDCAVINNKIESCIIALEGLLVLPGPNFTVFKTNVPTEVSYIDGKPGFHIGGHLIRDSKKDREDADRHCKAFIQTVVQNLRSRFLQEGDSNVLAAMSKVFDPRNYPECVDLEDEEYCHFGVEEVRTLSEHFKALPGFKASSAQQELPQFKCQVVKSFALNASSLQQLCKILLRCADQFPELAKLAKLALTIPVSTVSVERGFSQQNLIKTRLRTRLGTESLDRLMKICIEGPDVGGMDLDAAFKCWAGTCNRRLLSVV